jgi:hypothetical protein
VATSAARPALFGATTADRAAFFQTAPPQPRLTPPGYATHDSGSDKLRTHVVTPPVRSGEARFGSQKRVEMAIGFPASSRGLAIGAR